VKERVFHSGSVASILVIRLYFIGDVLLSTPVLAALRDSFPGARTTTLIKRRARDVLVGNPDVDEVLVYDEAPDYHNPIRLARLGLELRRRRFDLAVDLTGDLRSSWMLVAADPAFRVGFNHVGLGRLLDRRIPYRSEGHVVDHLLKTAELVGARTERADPRVYLTEEERDRARSLAGQAGSYLAMAPGANSPLRRWPARRFGELAGAARNGLGIPTVFVGAPSDSVLCEEAEAHSGGAGRSLAGRTSLRALAAVVGGARLFVGNDSGPLHIAAAAGTPVVGLFGPNSPDRFAPRGAPSRVVARRPPCSPCGQGECVGPDGPCMETIPVDEVSSALNDLARETEASR
jgi:lipopolysaccharide heptosyltransferase II